MELKSFKTYLSEQQQSITEIAFLAPLLTKVVAAIGGKAALARGAASLAATKLAADQQQANEPQPSTVMSSDQPQPAVTLRNPSGGQPPVPGRDPNTGRSQGDAEHRGNKYVNTFTGNASKATQAPFLGLNISLRGK